MKSRSRRQFLKQSTVAASLPLWGGWLAPFTGHAAAPSNQVRVGLIGCGGMGKGDLATFFLNAEVDCPVVCDIDDAKLAEASRFDARATAHRTTGNGVN